MTSSKFLFDRHTLNVLGFDAMQAPDYLAQFVDIGHAAALTRLSADTKSLLIPAAVLGVHRIVLSRYTKLQYAKCNATAASKFSVSTGRARFKYIVKNLAKVMEVN